MFAILLATLVGCSGDEPATPEAPEPAAHAEDPATEPPELGADELKSAAREATLVPSPTEMQKALAEAGVDKGLAALVPAHQAPKPGDERDQIAVRVGMDLAYTLLTVNDSDTTTETLVERLNQVKTGMASLGAGTDIGATIDDLTGRLQSDSLSREDLLSELDEIHGAVLPEIEFEAGENVVPLIQAGSWLAGTNLVAGAVIKAEKPEAGTKLLRQPEVAEHFVQYVRTDGADKAPAEVTKTLESTLTSLKEVAAKDSLTLDDVKAIETHTGNVLALL